MPRVNPLRSLANEANLARRIKIEREQVRHWTFDGLAKRMTNAGFAIQGSAIFKIENGGRRITVDELVGFGRVFGIEPGELLIPVELIEEREAQSIAAELGAASDALHAVVHQLIDAYTRMGTFLVESNYRTSSYLASLRTDSVDAMVQRIGTSLANDDPGMRGSVEKGIKLIVGATSGVSLSRVYPKKER